MQPMFLLIALCLCLWLDLWSGCCITGVVKEDSGEELMIFIEIKK